MSIKDLLIKKRALIQSLNTITEQLSDEEYINNIIRSRDSFYSLYGNFKKELNKIIDYELSQVENDILDNINIYVHQIRVKAELKCISAKILNDTRHYKNPRVSIYAETEKEREISENLTLNKFCDELGYSIKQCKSNLGKNTYMEFEKNG